MYDCETNVANCPVFRTLDIEERDVLVGLMESRTYEHGHSVIREDNSSPHGLWMVRRGDLEVLHSGYESSEQQIAVIHSGSVFGEMSFFDPQPHAATIRAITDCECLYLGTEHYRELEAYHPRTALKLITNLGRMLSSKMRRTDKMLVNRIF